MGAVRPVTTWLSTGTMTSYGYNYFYPGFQIKFGGNALSYFGVNRWGVVEMHRQDVRQPIPSSMSSYPYSPALYAFWADVSELTNPTYGTTLIDGVRAFVMNWTNVRYKNSPNAALTNTFQVVIYDEPGALHFEMNYDKIQWETGNTGTFPGGALVEPGVFAPALAGYRLDPKRRWKKPGSLTPGGLLDSNLDTGLIHNSLNSDIPGRYVYTMTSGIVSEQDDALVTAEAGNRRWFGRQIGGA